MPVQKPAIIPADEVFFQESARMDVGSIAAPSPAQAKRTNQKTRSNAGSSNKKLGISRGHYSS